MIVGIDLGTTYSLVARMSPSGAPMLLPDHSEHDVFHTPSVVHIGPNFAAVGSTVEALLEQDPELKAIRFFKRNFGENRPIYFDEGRNAWYPETIAALVLKKLRFDAESHSSNNVESAVVTVPAHFNDPQRKAVLSAAALADIPVLGLVEEPIAAAIHYGVLTASHNQVLLVYDLGGGTFDATALSLDPKGVYVLAKTGLTELGGKEFDERVGSMILEQFERALGAPLSLKARTLLELRKVSEELKIELCMPGKPHLRRHVLLGGEGVEVELSRSAFENSIGQLLDQAEEETRRCVAEAGLRESDIHTVLLVGGSSMVPAIPRRLQKIFGGPNQKVLHHEPSKAVAYGAALHSAQLSGDSEVYQLPPEFKGVSGYNVGVRAIDSHTGRVSIDTLIKKNMPLPAKVKKTYFTTRPNQQRIVIELVQYRDLAAEAVSLGELVVGPLPSPRQNYPVEVTVENREDGTVQVQAYDAQTGVELSQVFGRDGGDRLAQLAAQRALVRSTFINNISA
jgi:molecular chaperone DnaK (HSP70)